MSFTPTYCWKTDKGYVPIPADQMPPPTKFIRGFRNDDEDFLDIVDRSGEPIYLDSCALFDKVHLRLWNWEMRLDGIFARDESWVFGFSYF